MNRVHKPRLSVTLMLGVWFVVHHLSYAHPFHTSTAEMEFNRNSGRYEVALKILTTDLEKAVARHEAVAHKDKAVVRIDLEKTPQVDRLIVGYLKSNFFLIPIVPDQKTDNSKENRLEIAHVALAHRATSASTNALIWVGKESDQSSTWLYFELVPPAGNQPVALTNQLLFDLNSGQINSCIIRTDNGRTSIKTDARQPTATLPSIRR